MPRLVKKNVAVETAEPFILNTRMMAALAVGKKARDIRAYDVRGLTVVADAFLLCTVTSEPQMKAVFNAVKEGLKEAGVAPLHTEGATQDGWLLLDYGSVILHLFREQARTFYDLDGLWADAPEILLDLDG